MARKVLGEVFREDIIFMYLNVLILLILLIALEKATR